MAEFIPSPLPPHAEREAAALRLQIAALQEKFLAMAKPYTDRLAELEMLRPPPAVVLTREEAARLLPQEMLRD